MGQIDIRKLTYTDTGDQFYPVTHVDAVVGLDGQFMSESTFDAWKTNPGLYVGTTPVGSTSANQALQGILSVMKDTADSLIEWEPGSGGASGSWHFHGNLYADGWIGAGGIGSGGGGGGGSNVYWGDTSGHTVQLTVNDSMKTLLLDGALTGYATQLWANERFITIETDPIFTASPAYGITSGNISSWNAKADSSALASYALKTGSNTYDFLVNTLRFDLGTLSAQNYTAGSVTKPRPKWTYLYNSVSESKYLAFYDDIPTSLKNPNALTFGSKSYDGSSPVSLVASDIGAALTTDLSAYLPLTGGTMTGAITMNGANILSSVDSANQIGSVTNRFGSGYFRNLYTTYFGFRSGDNSSQWGNISMGDGLAQIILNTSPNNCVYTFNATYGFFHGGNGAVPCGRDDHRWSNVYSVAGNFSGIITVNGLETIDQSHNDSVLFNYGGRKTKAFNAYGNSINLLAHDSSGNVVNQVAINSQGALFKSGIYPNGVTGLSIGNSGSRWGDLYCSSADLTGNISFRNTGSGNRSGYISAEDGYLVFRYGDNVDSSFKQVILHSTYGLSPSSNGYTNLGYSTSRWSTLYSLNANLTGSLTMAATSTVTIGPVTISYDDVNKALHISGTDNGVNIGLYCDGFVAAGGIQ